MKKAIMAIALAVLLTAGIAYGQDTWIGGQQIWQSPTISGRLTCNAGTAPAAVKADGTIIWCADYLAAAGDNRMHFMGEGSASYKAAIGSGKVSVQGSTGGMTIQVVEATKAITADHTITITLAVPAGARIIGCQLRVDVALAAGETWNAAYAGGNTQTIGHEEAVAKNTKINVPFEGLDTGGTLAAQAGWAAPITTAATNIAIQKHSNPGVDTFTAQGTIRAIVYYEAFDTMASL